jgi:DNA-binding NarL/FixJ family response regulator
MLRAGIVSRCPIYLVGLTHALRESGITVPAPPSCPDLPRFMVVDAVLMDADLFASGDALASITAVVPHAPVLVVNNDEPAAEAGYRRAGARGVVGSREPVERILAALRVVAAGGELEADGGCRGPEPSAGPPDHRGLSDREFQVLHHIARGFTHGQIATRLGISPHTVDTYVKRVRAKLGVGNKAELTKVALLARIPATAGAAAAGPHRSG